MTKSKPENKIQHRLFVCLFDYSVFAFVVISSIVVSIFTFNGFLSLFSVFGTALYSFSICQKNIKVYRLLGIPCEALWVVYSIFISSALGILFEAILLGFIIASVVFYSQIDKLQSQKTLVKENDDMEQTKES